MKRYPVAKMNGPIKRLLTRDYPMVKYVVDATERLRLRLATPDVLKAEAKSFTNCPNARCIKRCLPGRAAVVSRAIAFVIEGNQATRYIMRKNGAARKIVENADLRQQGIVGQWLTLSVPHGNFRLGSKHKRGKNGGGVRHEPQITNTMTVQDGTVVAFAPSLRSY